MELQERMAEYIRTTMRQQNKSFSEFAEELGISRNALYGYSAGTGNPCLSTLEQIAGRLGVSPSVVLGLSDSDREEELKRLLETTRSLKDLEEDKRLQFVALFLEMVKLWDDD